MNIEASAKKNRMRNRTAWISVRAAMTSSAAETASTDSAQNVMMSPTPFTPPLPPAARSLRHRRQRIGDQPDVPRPLHAHEAERACVADYERGAQNPVEDRE